METKKILIYGKDGETKIVANGEVQNGEAFFEESKASTVANSLFNLARVLYSCADNEDTLYEVAVISNVYYKVMSNQLKEELWTGIERYTVEENGSKVERSRNLIDEEIQVRRHVVNSLQLAFANVNIINMGRVSEDPAWKELINKVKPQGGLTAKGAMPELKKFNL